MSMKFISLEQVAPGTRFFYPDHPIVQEVVLDVLGGKAYPVPEFLAGQVDAIIDVGANIGASAVYFALHFPGVPLRAFEPVRHTFDLMRKNVAPFPQVTAVNAGLLDRACALEITTAGAAGEGSSIKQSIAARFDSRAMADFQRASKALADLKGERRLLLKIDTEGCEVEIVTDLADFLPQVTAAYVEYHSDADRRWLDERLTGAGLILWAARATSAHRGEVCYLRRDLVDRASPAGGAAIL
ncbi:hypothetical protein JCM17960_22130 [Magnetospira thiophila]